MGRRGVILSGAATVVLLAACGGSSHKSSTTSSVATTAPATSSTPQPAITRGLVTSSEMPAGFSAQGQPGVTSTISQWLQQTETPSDKLQSETSRLKRLGFIGAASLNLNSSQGDGISLVEQFRSSAGPRSELADSLATFDGGPAGQVRFSVPGIPHAVGIGAPGKDNGVNVAFANGDYYYLVGEQANAPANRAGVIGAAQKLYQRVHG